MRVWGTRSFMRFMRRSSVVFPQPDGPMYAVMPCRSMDMETWRSAGFSPYQKETSSMSITGSSCTIFGVGGPFSVVMG